MVMHLQEEPPEPLNEYAQGRADRVAENQARLAASEIHAMRNELASDQPAAKRGRKRRADQENIPKVLCSRGCVTATAQVVASNITAVDAITCTDEVATALPGRTFESVLQVVPASDRTLRKQKGSQPDAVTPAAAALVMLLADAQSTPEMT